MSPPGPVDPAHAREALRQQMLLRAMWHDARPGVVAGWMRDGERFTRGLQAYQANAAALAERALAAAYPTVWQLLGAESFVGLARALWHAQAPNCGDIAHWGAGLPDFVQAAEQLAEEPFLADVARLDWAVHAAHSAADGAAAPTGLHSLAEADPAGIWLHARPGTASLVSAYPVVTLWQAHRNSAPDRLVPARLALAQGQAETALVWRQGLQVQVAAVAADEQAYTQALLQGLSLGQALARAAPAFNFERWLITALQRGWLAGAALEPAFGCG